MIQVRKSTFETNSSSTHCLTIMNRTLYDYWRDHTVCLSIHYAWNADESNEELGTDIMPSSLPSNFNDRKKSIQMSREKHGDENHDFYYSNLSYGDNGFMRSSGNFDSYASRIRVCSMTDQKKENIKMIDFYLNKDGWYNDYLKESGKYDHAMALLEEYKNTGKFTDEMYEHFPTTLFFTPEEYSEMQKHDDCYSPFIHVYDDVVAFGYYFHS